MTSPPSLRPSPELLRALLDQASEALFCIALQRPVNAACSTEELLEECLGSGRVEFANPAARRWLGLPPGSDDTEEPLPRAPDLADRLRDILAREGAARRVVREEQITQLIVRATIDDGSLSDDEAQRLQTAGLLVSGIAHDFHNLLTVMLGSAEIAMQQARHGDPTPHLEEIHAAARSAASLGQQLAALSYEREPELQPVELMPLVRRSVGMLRRLLDPSTRLTLEVDPETPRVNADPRQLEQALIGMVLAVRGVLPVDAHIHVGVGEDASLGLVRISVHGDHPLSTAVEPGGPGLAVARSVIERSGGRLTTQVAAGRCTLEALLDLGRNGPRSLFQAREEALGQGAGRAVLLVDDHDVLRHFMARLLRSFGYEVHAVSSANEALEISPAERASFALIITDVLMPDISGPEFVKRWRDEGLATPALFTSGASGSRAELKRQLGDDWTLLEKPFRNEDLLAALRKVRGS
ncbi:MAG: response regulator [Planctomycetes bacterium]|nr:response regulator [Planctomycetota bacterium]